jgi:C1A family cysteine protease
MVGALQYAQKNPIERESDYPYKAQNQNCKYNRSKGVVQAKQVFQVPQNNNAQLKAAVNKGPISIAIEADQTVFQFYKGGIISSGCGTATDHGVLVVGYGDGYWIVKNSWGPNWGEKGFVRIADKSGAGVCGINTGASYATTN